MKDKTRPFTLQVNNITFRHFGEKSPTLVDFTLECPKGQITVLLGPNACGKSTLLDIVAGLRTPSAGDVLIDGDPYFGGRRDLGFIFQKDNCLPWLTVEENLTFGSENVRDSDLDEVLKVFGLHEKRTAYPNRFSGGEQQRIAIARLALMNASIILCDEPFSSTDTFKRQEMWTILQELVLKNKATALVVTHEPGEAFLHGDVVCMLRKGPMTVCAKFFSNSEFRGNTELQKCAYDFYVQLLKGQECLAVPDLLRGYTVKDTAALATDSRKPVADISKV